MTPAEWIDKLTVRTVDRRNPADLLRWREAEADALRARLREIEDRGTR